MKPGVALVAGGGIGGISAALALGRHGWHCRILERRPEASEAGAGIQIGPNGMRILERLGVRDALAPLSSAPNSVQLRDGRSGELLSSLPLGDWIAKRHSAPYCTVHRADLHAALSERLGTLANADLIHSFEIAGVETTATGVTVQTSDGQTATGDILIGADGIYSAVRRVTFGDFPRTATGRIAARSVVAVNDAKTDVLKSHVGVWLASGAHVVHYPVRGGAEIALVVVTQGSTRLEGWNTAIDASAVLNSVSSLAPELLSLLAQAPAWRQWTLTSAPELPTWSKDRTVLLGDATQAILPFLAQGAVMALEDAEALSCALDQHASINEAFASYELARRNRKRKVQAAAARNGWIYHLSGSLALARNITLRTMPGSTMMASLDWLYGHRP